MRRPDSSQPFLLFALTLVPVAALAATNDPVEFRGAAILPSGCFVLGADPWKGGVRVDGRLLGEGILTADVFPKGFQPGDCTPAGYGFVADLQPTADPATRRVNATLTMERCHLSPLTSLDLEPVEADIEDEPDVVHGQLVEGERFTTLTLQGNVKLYHREDHADGTFVEFGCDFDEWTLSTHRIGCQPKAPPPGAWDELPPLPRPAPRVKCRAGGKCKKGGKAGVEAAAEAAAARLVPVEPCAAATLCLGKPGSDRADVLVRNVELLDGTQALAYLTLTTSQVEVWRLLDGQADPEAVSWLFPALGGEKTDNAGLLDAWDSSSSDFELRSARRAASAEVSEPGAAKGTPKPPSKTWLSFDAVPGFRFQVRYGAWLGLVNKKNGTASAACPSATACFGRAAAEPATVFVRLIAEKNAARSPVLAKFALEPVEVWIEQTAPKRLRYYRLEGTPFDAITLDGEVGREAFPK